MDGVRAMCGKNNSIVTKICEINLNVTDALQYS